MLIQREYAEMAIIGFALIKKQTDCMMSCSWLPNANFFLLGRCPKKLYEYGFFSFQSEL